MKKKIVKASGITLIALVVTIVVLLILAGITISLVFSENGIIAKAREAADKTNQAAINEQEEMNKVADYMSNMVNGTGGSTAESPSGPEMPEGWDENKVNAVESADGVIVPVPKGYTASSVVTENTVSDGFVIYEGEEVVNDSNKDTAQTTRNQFVWVPVANINLIYDSKNKAGKLYSFTSDGAVEREYPGKNVGYREPDVIKGNGEEHDFDQNNLQILGLNDELAFENQLQSEFDVMINSVEKYKGFYIGRYETGNLESNNTSVPVSVKQNDKNAYVNWYYIYNNSKKVGNNVSTKSSMIWGCQWDRVLQWIVETGDKTYDDLRNPETWGNYKNSTGNALAGSGEVQPTGYSEYWKVNNIYDLAGNVFDWTIESHENDFRIFRGENYAE